MGKLEEARPLYEEALQGERETLGDRHPSTLTSINCMGVLLQEMGKLEEARPLLEEDLQASRETLGDRHPDTLISIYNMGDLLETQGSLAEAIPLFTEELEGLVVLRGMEYQETRDSAKHLAELLHNAGHHDEATALAAKHGVIEGRLCNGTVAQHKAVPVCVLGAAPATGVLQYADSVPYETQTCAYSVGADGQMYRDPRRS
eukprot:scaffold28115_cov70-Phaeocystis_antarctica.AAC.1